MALVLVAMIPSAPAAGLSPATLNTLKKSICTRRLSLSFSLNLLKIEASQFHPS